MILYECFGLPGGGKTTTVIRANETLGLPTTADISTYWQLLPLRKKILLILTSFHSQYTLWVQIIAFIIVNKITAPRSLIYLFKIPAQKILIQKFIQDKPLLLDQWQLQNLWSAVLNAQIKNIRRLPPLIAAIYKGISPYFFYFNVDMHQAAERISGRVHGQSRFDVMARHEIFSALHDTSMQLETILKSAQALNLPFTEIDGNAELNASAERLIRACGR